MSKHYNAEISEADRRDMDWAEIVAIRTWLDRRNSGLPYPMADYRMDTTMAHLRWLLEHAERVGRPEKRKCRPKSERDQEHLIANLRKELKRLWIIENRYEALLTSSRRARSRAGGRR